LPEGKLPRPSLLVLIALREVEPLGASELEEAVGIPVVPELVPGTVTGEREEVLPEVAVLPEDTKLLAFDTASVALIGDRLLELTGALLVASELRPALLVGALVVVRELRPVLLAGTLVDVGAGALAVVGVGAFAVVGGGTLAVAGGGVGFGGAALGAGAGLG
jgi:hypothetical protein